MTLNELLSGDAVWEDAFIEHISKNEFIDNLLLYKDCIDFQLYDDLKDQRISRENDVRVIEQYREGLCEYYEDCWEECCIDDCNLKAATEIKNDLRVNEDELFERYCWEKHMTHLYYTYVIQLGFSLRQAERLWKISKIKKRIGTNCNSGQSKLPLYF